MAKYIIASLVYEHEETRFLDKPAFMILQVERVSTTHHL